MGRRGQRVRKTEEGMKVFLQRPMSLTLLIVVLSVLLLPRVAKWVSRRRQAV